MLVRCWLIAVVAMSFIASEAKAHTSMTTDGNFLYAMRIAITSFQEDYESKLPDKWADLDAYIEDGVEMAFSRLQATERYALISPPISFTSPFQGELIIVSRRAFQEVRAIGDMGEKSELSDPKHYILYKNLKGDLMIKKLTEKEVNGIFNEAGASRVAEDSLPEREYVASFRKELLLKRVFIYAILPSILLIVTGWVVIRKKRITSGWTTPQRVCQP